MEPCIVPEERFSQKDSHTNVSVHIVNILRKHLFIVLYLLNTTILAQVSYDIGGGLSRSNLILTETDDIDVNVNPMNGLYIYNSLNIEKEKINFQIRQEALKKNYMISSPSHLTNFERIDNNFYLQSSFISQYNLVTSSKIYIHIGLGTYFGFWIDRKIKGVIPNAFHTSYDIQNEDIIHKYDLFYYQYKSYFNKNADNRLDIGLAAITTVNYLISDQIKSNIQFNLNRSIVANSKLKYSAPKYFYNISIVSIGLSLKI